MIKFSKLAYPNFFCRRIIMKEAKELPNCPVTTTVSLIHGKWKPLIIRNLLNKPKRFSELQNSLEGISRKVLTANLKAMEKDGIIVRTVYPKISHYVEYSLSKLGESLRPIINDIEKWGLMYRDER